MKSKTVFTMALAALLFVMMFTALHIPPARAQGPNPTPVFTLPFNSVAEPVVSVNQSTITWAPYQIVSVCVNVSVSAGELDLFAYQMNMTWTPTTDVGCSLLDYTPTLRLGYGPFQMVGPKINNDTGQLMCGETCLSRANFNLPITPANSPLTLFTVTFQGGPNGGSSSINLINVELFGLSDDGNGWPSGSDYHNIQENTSYAQWPDPNGDGYVNIYDLILGANHWGQDYHLCDFNEDGFVDTFDFAMIAADYGKSSSDPTWPSEYAAVTNPNSIYPYGLTNTIYQFSCTIQVGSAYVPSDEWPMFHHDLTHTGYSTSTAPTTNQTLWTYTTGFRMYSPAIVGGVVYVGSQDYKVYALNATTGAQAWNYTTGNSVMSSPAVANGIVYVGSGDGNVYALNTTTGAQIWNYTTGGRVLVSSPAVAGDVVYVGSEDNKVYALNATTGAFIWDFTTGGVVYSSPAVAGGVVFVGSWDGNVYALNTTTGAQIWNYTTGNLVDSSPAVVGGVVYVGSEDNKVYALNATTGAQVWNYTTGSYVEFSSPAVAGDVAYVGSGDGNVYALNATTGTQIWNYTTGSYVLSSPAVASGVVYVGSYDYKVYALNATTGAQVWSYTTGSYVWSSPTVAGGIVYVGSMDGNIYAFGTLTPSSSISPSFSTLDLGQSQLFTSTVSGGTPPYTYQWYLNGSAVQGANSSSWTFTPNLTGSYTIYANVTDSVGAQATSNDATVTVNSLLIHDIAVTNVASSRTVVARGFSAAINVTVANQGGYTETFNITAYANATSIGSKNVTLPAGNSTTLTFTWNTTGFAYGNYTISAYALPVSGETNTTDNNMSGGTAYVSIPGDVKGDGIVNILDAIVLGNHFLEKPGMPGWSRGGANADINGDGVVNILDAIILGNHFLETNP